MKRLARLPYQPVADYIGRGTSLTDHARVLDVNVRTLYRWLAAGVPACKADAVAKALWLHPANLWGPNWDAERGASA